ncbi:hypothetical protein EDE15_4212 [Edaphobacter aggregans]|jgi:hypothetical protein|uniref:Uncharacterized protein n=1 Tax=Edaphobacter aggregans TaxID=570835 RepID=A0A3R9P121_9BACT|nr:hypothetical protein [Edaphobacter aggregans]RSL18622.1 hypothetical protein EDE15_4212 [Edaphobacter aggregans]
MKISDRFTDYGLIGGLFWVLQFIIWFAWRDEPVAQVFASFTGHFDKITGASATLVAAIGLIAVFSTGLFINVAGVVIFRRYETFAFRDNLNRNLHWLKPFLDANSLYVRDDLRRIVAPLGYEKRRAIDNKIATSEGQNERKGIFEYSAAARDAYVRLDSFLLSYVAIAAGADKTKMHDDRIALADSVRAVAAALVIWGMEMIGFILVSKHTSIVKALTVLSMCAMSGLALNVVIGAFQRVCSTLFALVYVIYERDHPELKPGSVTTVKPPSEGILKPS